MSLNKKIVCCSNFPFHQLFQGSVKQLDLWISQLMSVADPDDYSILIMKFNRKGKFVAIDFDKHNDTPLFVERHFLYNHETLGRWAIMDYDRFWLLNKDYVALNSN